MVDRYADELCRLCLYKCDYLVDIFVVNERHGYLASEVIQDLLLIEVGMSDGFPRCICSICLNKLTDFKVFKEQCLKSLSTFQEEFRLRIEQATQEKLQDVQVDQDPLACLPSIKEETPDSEEIEIPVEGEAALEKEVSKACLSSIKEETPESEEVAMPVEDDSAAYSSYIKEETPESEVIEIPVEDEVTVEKEVSESMDGSPSQLDDSEEEEVAQHPDESVEGMNFTPSSVSPIGKDGMDSSPTTRTRIKNQSTKKMYECYQSEEKIVNKCNNEIMETKAVNGPERREQGLSQEGNWPHKESSEGLGEKYCVSRARSSRVVGGRSHVCTVCSKSYTDCSALKRHMRTHTGEKTYICSVCSKSFTHHNTLVTHTRIHTGEKPYSCSVCAKSFNLRNNLVTHMRSHTGEKHYSCSVCSMCFTYFSTMKRHIGTHTGEKPYLCSVCAKTFTECTALKRHMRTHTGEKRYLCSICPKSFTQHSNLVTHIRTHTGEKPYTCSICSKAFTDKSSLKSHMRMHTREPT